MKDVIELGVGDVFAFKGMICLYVVFNEKLKVFKVGYTKDFLKALTQTGVYNVLVQNREIVDQNDMDSWKVRVVKTFEVDLSRRATLVEKGRVMFDWKCQGYNMLKDRYQKEEYFNRVFRVSARIRMRLGKVGKAGIYFMVYFMWDVHNDGKKGYKEFVGAFKNKDEAEAFVKELEEHRIVYAWEILDRVERKGVMSVMDMLKEGDYRGID